MKDTHEEPPCRRQRRAPQRRRPPRGETSGTCRIGSCPSRLRLSPATCKPGKIPHFTTAMRDFAMVSPLIFYQLGLIALVWLCVMLHGAWLSDSAAACSTTPEPTPPVPKPPRVPKPYT